VLAVLSLPAALLWPGWPWLLGSGLGLFLLGCLTGLIGMLGLQLMTLSDRVRNVPMVIELERLNFPAD
jgi:polyisoprenyl-phosphate glycosyltransferase